MSHYDIRKHYGEQSDETLKLLKDGCQRCLPEGTAELRPFDIATRLNIIAEIELERIAVKQNVKG